MSNDGVAPLRVAEAKKFVAISRARLSPIGAAVSDNDKAKNGMINSFLLILLCIILVYIICIAT